MGMTLRYRTIYPVRTETEAGCGAACAAKPKRVTFQTWEGLGEETPGTVQEAWGGGNADHQPAGTGSLGTTVAGVGCHTGALPGVLRAPPPLLNDGANATSGLA